MKNTNTMGNRIRTQRKKIGMTQEQLAEAIYTKKATISAYENDRIDIKSSIVVELAKVLQCSVSFLMEGNKMKQEYDELVYVFGKIKSQQIRKVALEQMKILAMMNENEVDYTMKGDVLGD